MGPRPEAVAPLQLPAERDPVLQEGQRLLVLADDAHAVGVLGVHDVDLEARAGPQRHLALDRQAHLVAVLLEGDARRLPGLEGLHVGGLVGEHQVGQAGPVEGLDALGGDQAAVGVELDRHAARLGVGHDLRQVGVQHGLAHLVQLDGVERPQPGALAGQLVQQPEGLLLLHEAAPPVHDLVGAPGALEVARVGDLDEQVVDRIEAPGQLLELGQRRRHGEALRPGRLAAEDAQAQQPEVAAELQPEGGPQVLGAPAVEVGQREERRARPLEAGRLPVPALLGGLVQPLVGGLAPARGVLQPELAEAGALVVDLHPQPLRGPLAEGRRQGEVEVVAALVGREAGLAAGVSHQPAPVALVRDGDLAPRSARADLQRQALGDAQQALEGGAEAGQARAHRRPCPASSGWKVPAITSAQRATRWKASSRASKTSV